MSIILLSFLLIVSAFMLRLLFYQILEHLLAAYLFAHSMIFILQEPSAAPCRWLTDCQGRDSEAGCRNEK